MSFLRGGKRSSPTASSRRTQEATCSSVCVTHDISSGPNGIHNVKSLQFIPFASGHLLQALIAPYLQVRLTPCDCAHTHTFGTVSACNTHSFIRERHAAATRALCSRQVSYRLAIMELSQAVFCLVSSGHCVADKKALSKQQNIINTAQSPKGASSFHGDPKNI